MKPKPLIALAGGLFIAAASTAQNPSVTFAPPVRLQAGEKFVGEQRYFPSPVFHDMNGDGMPDIVVGDLIGKLTVALRRPGGGPIAFEAETAVKAADGKDLKFHNW